MKKRPGTVLLLIAAFWLGTFGSTIDVRAAEKAADLVTDGQPIDVTSQPFVQLFAELEQEHGFTSTELHRLFKDVTIKRRVLVLMDKQWEAKPYYQYYPLFVTSKVIRQGKEKLRQHSKLLGKVEETFGVDREVVVAIWAIETRFGSYQGGFPVLQSLATLFAAYPRRSAFFREQLIDFLLLCRDNGVDPTSVKGSYAGAFGQTQFIPSSFRTYAVSFDGDQQRDVWHSIPDILASIANYLSRFGWVLNAPVYAELGYELHDRRLLAAKLQGRKGRVPVETVRAAQHLALPPSPENKPLSIVGLELAPDAAHPIRYVAGYPNFQAITAWNHSNRYAMAVSELAEAFAE